MADEGNTVLALARWWHPVALSEALGVLHRGMHPALYCCIGMVIKTSRDFPVFFGIVVILLLLSLITIAKLHVMVIIH